MAEASSSTNSAKNPDLHRRLAQLRFLAVLAIVGLHAQTVYLGDHHAAFFDRFFQEWTASWLLRVGLPVLSAISGYLMLFGWQSDWSFYGKKIQRRIRSLLVPFLSVSLLTVMAYRCIQAIPGMADFFARPLIRDWTLMQWWDRLLINPLNYPIYFLRDLFLVALLAPLLAWLLRTRALAVVTLLSLFVLWWLQQGLWIWNTRLLAWFALGGALSLHPDWRWQPGRVLLIGASMVWLGLSAYGAWDAAVSGDRSRDLNHAAKLVGIGVFFFSVVAIPDRGGVDRFLGKVAPWCFPLFLFHNPVVNFGKKVALKMVGDVSVLPSVVWLGAWITASALIVFLIAPIGSRFGGAFWRWITGGR